jgi:hypothetical protein
MPTSLRGRSGPSIFLLTPFSSPSSKTQTARKTPKPPKWPPQRPHTTRSRCSQQQSQRQCLIRNSSAAATSRGRSRPPALPRFCRRSLRASAAAAAKQQQQQQQQLALPLLRSTGQRAFLCPKGPSRATAASCSGLRTWLLTEGTRGRTTTTVERRREITRSSNNLLPLLPLRRRPRSRSRSRSSPAAPPPPRRR